MSKLEATLDRSHCVRCGEVQIHKFITVDIKSQEAKKHIIVCMTCAYMRSKMVKKK